MSETDAPPSGNPAADPLAERFGAPFPQSRPLRRWPTVLAWVLVPLLVLVTVAGIVAAEWHVNYVVISPGQAQPVGPLITVPSHGASSTHGKILLTDVYENPLTAWGYLMAKLNSDDQIYPTQEVIPGNVSNAEFVSEEFLDMSASKSNATAAALTYLGYHISVQNGGVLVYEIADGSPASKVLKLGQVITKMNGTATPTDCALITALHGVAPGTTVTLQVEQSYINDLGAVVPGPTVAKTVTVAAPPKGLVIQGCGAPIRPTAYLGIGTETQLNWRFPVKVTVQTPDIGGPSAGLAMTLGIIDKLSGGHLIGNKVIAATGTINAFGQVGDVGGVAQKTIAVERAGATVFFVPPQELAAARSKDTPQLHVYAVSNVTQALAILKKLGGTVPANHVLAQAAP